MRLPQNSLGQQGESRAKKLLQNKGYTLIAENFSTKFGEIDLIFTDRNQLIFVEVKTRSSDRLGHPEEAVNHRKIAKISRVGEYFMVSHPDLPQSARIDVIAIEGDQIQHFQNISQ